MRGPGIEVGVSWWTQTGTTHLAEELTITTASGTLRMASSEDGEGPELPLIERIHEVSSDRWVLLGWSSYGSGMQTEHAWLVDGSRAPRVVDTLAWTTDRSHAGIAVEVSRKLEIGIPLPGDDALHDVEGWQLVHGGKTLDLAKVRTLPAHHVDLAALGAFYTPPFQRPPIERRWSGAFVWWVADKRFTVQKL